MVAATKAAREVEDPGLRAELQVNIAAVRAGAVGPDVFYFPPSFAQTLGAGARAYKDRTAFSDMAHYCKTNELARSMIGLAGGDPVLKAFGYGWFAHNIEDSVAHPWVNGFTGGTFDLPFRTNGKTHGHIEGWVNSIIVTELSDKDIADALYLYRRQDVQDLIVKAYEATYGADHDCKGPVFPKLTRADVDAAGANGMVWVLANRGGVHDWPTTPHPEDVPIVFRTWRDYFDLSVNYTAAGWGDTARLPALNMDQGIDSGKRGVQDAYRNVPEPRDGKVFPVPGLRYTADGLAPAYQDTCAEKFKRNNSCGGAGAAGPGGDTPDDNVSTAAAVAADGAGTPPLTGFLRLAVKHGELWPVVAAEQSRRVNHALELLGQGDQAGFAAEIALARQALRTAVSADPRTAEVLDAHRQHPALYESVADVAVLDQAFADAARSTLGSFDEPAKAVGPGDVAWPSLQQPILLLPTGSLAGLTQNRQFRAGIESYVASGGTAVVFAQQHGSDYAVLPTPDGRPIGAWGWFEDNSCYWNGAYIDTFHPILASQPQSLVTSAIDGSFDNIPESATVLLRRVKDSKPVMFMYPYGQGWVIVTSSYDDWGGFNQTTPGAQAIIRDAIAWAKKPADLPLNAPGSTASINLHVRNITDVAASQVRLTLMSPSRDRVVVEQTVGVAVAAGGTAEVPFSYAFPADAELGIYHVDYELLDGTGAVVQPVAEEDTGRIVVAKPPTTNPYRPSDLGLSVVMPGGEDALRDAPTAFRYRLVNRAGTDRRFRLYQEFDHRRAEFLREVVIPANGVLEDDFVTPAVGYRFWIHVFEEGGVEHPRPYAWFDPGMWPYQLSDGKGLRLHWPRASFSVVPDKPVYRPGDVAQLAVRVKNEVPVAWDGRLALRLSTELPVLAEAPVHLEAGGSTTVTVPLSVSNAMFGMQYWVVASRGDHTAGWALEHLAVAVPEVGATGAPTVAGWSRTSPNVVTWPLRNQRAVPLEGTLTARLEGAGTPWETTEPLALGPNEAREVTVTVPALPAGFQEGQLVLVAHNGFDQRLTAQMVIRSSVSGGVAHAAGSYDAGQSGEVVVVLHNQGTMFEDGEMVGSIEGIGSLGPAAFSLLPRGQATLRFPFTVPLYARGGLHAGRLTRTNGSPVTFSVRVSVPRLALAVEDRPYTVGESIPVVLRNTGGSKSTARVAVRLDGTPVATATTVEVSPGEETTVALPLPSHSASRVYWLVATATDDANGVTVRFDRNVTVAGTSASLAVSTDQAIYAASAPLEATARLTNGPLPLSGGLLQWEIVRECTVQGGPPISYHVETWDGAAWVERAVRHMGTLYETAVLDLAPYLPDATGAYRVRIRHAGASRADLDYVALLSSGSFVAPTAAEREGQNVLALVVAADDQAVSMPEMTLSLTFPEAPAPSLVFRAREGEALCPQRVVWHQNVPLDLTGSQTLARNESLQAPDEPGQYFLRGAVVNRDGTRLAWDEQVFQVTGLDLAVSIGSDQTLYRRGTPITVSGVVSNRSGAEVEDVNLVISRKTDSPYPQILRDQWLTVAAGGEVPWSVTFTADMDEENLTATLRRLGEVVAASGWAVRAGEPQVHVSFTAPDPLVKLVPTSLRPVVLWRSDLDQLSVGGADVEGALPFPVTLLSVTYDRFRQSTSGFVELVPASAAGPTGTTPACLDRETVDQAATVLAGALGDLGTTGSGFVGMKAYAAGSFDRSGRVFPSDTVVFAWDAPGEDPRRFQVLLSRDGLIRFDADVMPLPSSCAKTGLATPQGVFGFSGAALFGLRAETGVGHVPFKGTVEVKNDGTYPGSVTLDYGRVDGTRTTETVPLAIGEGRTLTFEDAVSGATTYSVVATGDAEGTWQREVIPGEGLRVEYTGAATYAPGSVSLPVRMVKTGGVGGPVQVTYALAGSTVIRTYDLEPGFWTQDAVSFDVPEGTLALTATSDVPLTMPAASFQVGPEQRMAMTVTAGAIAGGRLPIGVDLVSSGLASFRGEIQIVGASNAPLPVMLAAGQAGHHDISVDLLGQTPGPHTYVVRLVSEAGVALQESAVEREVRPAHMALVSSPAGQSFDAGTLAQLHFRLRNDGDQPTLGRLRFDVFDEAREASFSLGPGAETEVVFELPLDPDVEQKVYAGRYVIEGDAAEPSSGQINFTVNGIALTVDASLDKDAYAEGDTAHFTVNVTNGRPGLGTAYLVRVHYAAFDERRSMAIETGTTAVFDVPLPQITGESLFLGITHPDGRSLYINTYHVRNADSLARVTVDQQVYAPGAAVTISASSATPGRLTLGGPGYSETLDLSGSASRTFTLPADLPGGTHFVTWSFAATDSRAASGSVPFDVSGLRVRVFEARLDKGRYETGDTIETTLRIHTNQAASVLLRAFILDPEGASTLAGESVVSLQPSEDLFATHAWPFASSVAGLHRLVYGIYLPGEALLASGSLAFDVGRAAVLGVKTDKAEYPLPGEPVQVSVQAFVAAPATLRLDLDGDTVATQEVTVLGIQEIPLTLATLGPGRHDLVAILEGGGYTSRRGTSFSLGTTLPDLVAFTPTARAVSGASWKVEVTVSNEGRSEASATSVSLSTGTTTIGTASIPALLPGAKATAAVDWNVSGLAGARELQASVAPVLEFRTDNNVSVGEAAIPALQLTSTTSASYPANVTATFATSVVNLTADTTFTGITVEGSVERPDGAVVMLPSTALAPLGPGAAASASASWDVGRSIPGAYRFTSEARDAAGASQGVAGTFFEVLRTPAFSGSVAASPQPAIPGSAVALQGHIVNQGNVASEGTARFDVLDTSGTVAARAERPASVPLEGSTDVATALDPLDMPPGNYTLDLRMSLPEREYPVASTPFAVSGSHVETTLGSDLTPRVLVYVGGDAASRPRRTAFVQASLSGAVLKTTSDPLEFARLMRSGLWNTSVVMTDVPVLLPLLADELREAAFRGDGLMLAQWRAGSTPALDPALGGRIQGHLPGSSHTLTLLDGPLGPAETIPVTGWAARFTPSDAAVAGTMEGKVVLTTHPFGRGRAVAMAFDPTVEGTASLKALFGRAVGYVAPREERDIAPGTVLPLAISLNNPATTAQTVEVSLTLPPNVILAGIGDEPTSTQPPTWTVSLSAGAQKLLRFQVVVPDEVGVFRIESSVKVGGVVQPEQPTFELNVTRTVATSLSETIAALEATVVDPPDHGHLQAAIALLRTAQALGQDVLALEAKIRLAAEAGEKLGRITSANVTAERLTLTHLVAAWERAWNEALGATASGGVAERTGGSAGRSMRQ